MTDLLWKVIIGHFVAGLAFCHTLQFVGPWGSGPKENPVILMNELHAHIEPNAADVWLAAADKITDLSPDDLMRDVEWQEGEPLPANVIACLDENQEAIELARNAASIERCWFELVPEDLGYDIGFLRELSEVKDALEWNAKRAIEARDWQTLGEMARVLSALGTDTATVPGLLTRLRGCSVHYEAQVHLLSPFTWDLPPKEEATYTAMVKPLLEEPLPPLVDAIREDKWFGKSLCAVAAWKDPRMYLALPPGRVYGEIDKRYAPVVAWAAAPIHVRANQDNPLATKAKTLRKQQAALLNISGIVADMFAIWPDSAIATDVASETLRRGMRTALELFTIRDRAGEFPESLDGIDAEYKIDPYSGKPFAYERKGDDFILYSLGVDREDDGGRHDGRFGRSRDRKPPDGDYVFWPIGGNTDDR